jgi:ATP-dependent protease ClpP protease subunit
MQKVYLRAFVRNDRNGPDREGMAVELFRLDAAEEAGNLTEAEAESVEEVSETEKSSTAIMRIYEEIGEDWFTGEGITAKKFSDELAGLGEGIKRLNIHINCLGGDVFAAQTIHNIIEDYPAKKTSYIDGICASAATLIASAADEVIARHNTNYMIHLPLGMTFGNAAEHRKTADTLDALTSPIVSVYKEQVKGKIDEEKILALMTDETWMTADKAFEYGFVDEVRGKIKAIARVSSTQILCSGRLMNLKKYPYQNAPKFPYAKQKSPENKLPKKEEKPMTSAQLREEHPQVFADVQREAREAERARLSALDSMLTPENNAALQPLIMAAKADGRGPEQIAMECFNLTKAELGKVTQLNALKKDAGAVAGVKAGDAPLVPPPPEVKTGKGAALFANAMKAQKPGANRLAAMTDNGQK